MKFSAVAKDIQLALCSIHENKFMCQMPIFHFHFHLGYQNKSTLTVRDWTLHSAFDIWKTKIVLEIDVSMNTKIEIIIPRFY